MSGPVVASTDALFLKVDKTVVPAGMLGGAVVRAIGLLVKGTTYLHEIDLAELPPQIADDPEWPIRQKDGRVFVIPRDVVRRLHYPWWGTLRVHTEEHRFNIAPFFLRRKKVIRVLRELDWDV